MNGPVVPLTEPGILEVYGLWMFGIACLIPANFISCLEFVSSTSEVGGLLGHWRILPPVRSFIFILASVQPVCVVWVLTGSPGSSQWGLAGWVAVGRVACGRRPPAAGGGEQPWCRPPSFPPGGCWLSWGCPPAATPPGPPKPSGVSGKPLGRSAEQCRRAVAVGVLTVSRLSPRQCSGLMTEKDGGPVPVPPGPRFLMCWEKEWVFCRFIIGL